MKKYYMVLDTETVTDARIPYDVAWIIIDRKGQVYERFNAFVSEILTNPTLRYLVRRDSFSKKKAHFYLNCEQPPMDSFLGIYRKATETIKKYNCTIVAYNAAFDIKVLDDYCKVLYDAPFFTDDAEIWDLWNMALNTICDSSNYVRWCVDSGFITEKGNISCSAEAVYSYLSHNEDFEEDHTALSDCEIEAKILQTIFNRKQKLYTDFCAPVMHQKVWKNRLKEKIEIEKCPCCGRPLTHK